MMGNNARVRIWITALAACVVAGAAEAQTTAWPTVRHDNQRSGRSPIVASQADDTIYPVVSICCSSSIPSNPVTAADGTVYFSLDKTLLAIDPSTGIILWSLPDAGTAPTLGPDGAIYVVSGQSPDTTTPGFVKALNADGTLRWSYETPEPATGLPLVTVDQNGLAYGVYGAVLQQAPLITGVFRFALDADGAELWRVGGVDEGGSFIPPAIADDGAIFEIGSSPGDTHQKLRRIDPITGEVVWSAPNGDNMPVLSTPLITGDGLVIVSLRDNSTFPWTASLVAYDRFTGAEGWSLPYDDPFGIYSVSGSFASPVLLGNGEIISFWDKIYRVAPAGQLLATAPFPAEMDNRSVPVAGGDDTLYVWTAGPGPDSVIAFSAFSGSVKFLYTPPSAGCIAGVQPAIGPDGSVFATWRRKTVCEDFTGTAKYVSFAAPVGKPCDCTDNLAPTSVIVGDQAVPPLTLVTLDGMQSSDPEGQDLFYEWRELVNGNPGPILSLESTYARTTGSNETQVFQLRVTDCCDVVDFDTFTQVTLPAGVITSPTQGDTWPIETVQSIEWVPDGGPTSRVIQVSRNNGPWETIAVSTPNDGQYTWAVTGPTTDNAVIRIFPAGNPNAAEQSGQFSIVNPTPGDLDGDGTVGILDLLMLLSSWGPCQGACPADLDGDGLVGILDLLMLLSHWG